MLEAMFRRHATADEAHAWLWAVLKPPAASAPPPPPPIDHGTDACPCDGSGEYELFDRPEPGRWFQQCPGPPLAAQA